MASQQALEGDVIKLRKELAEAYRRRDEVTALAIEKFLNQIMGRKVA